MTKFKVGNKVRCIKNRNHNELGAGWKDGLEFIIKDITNRDGDRPIYWEGERGHGVYEDALELVSKSSKNNNNKKTMNKITSAIRRIFNPSLQKQYQWEKKYLREGWTFAFGSLMNAYSQINQGKGIELEKFKDDAEKLYEQAQVMVRNAVIETEPEIVEPIKAPELPDD